MGDQSLKTWRGLIPRSPGGLKEYTCTIDHVSENGDIFIDIHEDFPCLIKGNQIIRNKKGLRTLKQIADI